MSWFVTVAVATALDTGIEAAPVTISGNAKCQTCGPNKNTDADRFGAAAFDCVKDGVPRVDGVVRHSTHCTAAHDEWERQLKGMGNGTGVRVKICSELGNRPCQSQIDVLPVRDDMRLVGIRVLFTTPDTEKHDDTWRTDQELFLLDGNSIEYGADHPLRIPTPTPVSNVHLDNPCPGDYLLGWTNLGEYWVEAWRTADGQPDYPIDAGDGEQGKAFIVIREMGAWTAHIWRCDFNPLDEKFCGTEVLRGPMVGAGGGTCDAPLRFGPDRKIKPPDDIDFRVPRPPQ